MILRVFLSLALAITFTAAPMAQAQDATAVKPSAKQLAARGVAFLRSSQDDDGSFSSFAGPAITALAATGLQRSGVSTSDPAVAKAIDYLLKHRREDGGIYGEGSNHRNYETALAVVCLAEANKDGKYDEIIAKAEAFLKNIQWDEEDGTEKDNLYYGGGGYGSHDRPDLSNTSFLLDALTAAGNGADDPAIQKALVFVSRTQNLESEFNSTEFAAKIGDGGFFYTPASGGQSKAGETENGGLRSYGSMTYAGLKSLIYAGLDKDDVRVKAATSWIKKNYTLDNNPGMGTSGQFYYYHTFAKALSLLGDDVLVDEDGNEHDWSDELVSKLAEMQKSDGSWLNSDERWMEADPNLVTGYVLIALSYCEE
ncbi:prenyltransferase/squalene oxidase repeat-containing protein [Aeoliella mucimassa]|uniref:Prenyltransferase and squalene oxidase repeat protein n=1 Tax=Aeoliella mucimassa TaxID=2527972 RepID=A0A518AUR6_9BACT|nr:prenyltransferase/squalene oxidase repeat-containing protein [Aeoliella mucimassa]QDU58458.1 Prenyltransferase and squalene oxidase repeat protein [Aeoliella mucimassa]